MQPEGLLQTQPIAPDCQVERALRGGLPDRGGLVLETRMARKESRTIGHKGKLPLLPTPDRGGLVWCMAPVVIGSRF
jgi:hypothetical protein